MATTLLSFLLSQMGGIIARLLLLFSFLPLLVSGRRITCTSPENVHKEEFAVITCNYFLNLREHRRGFYIYKYPFGGKDPDVPAICDWDEDFIRCDVRAGYNVKVQGHRMTLNISSAQESHAGRYVCHVLQPEDDIESQECDLVVHNREAKINCHAIAYPLQKHAATIMCFVPDSLEATSVVLERRDIPSDAMATEEILRCNSRTDMCLTRGFGYQYTVPEPVSSSFKVMIGVVDKPGLYLCKVEGTSTQSVTCHLEADKGIETVPAKETTSTHSVSTTFVLSGVAVFLVVIIIAVIYIFRTFRWCAVAKRSGKSTVGVQTEQVENPKAESASSSLLNSP